MSHPMAVASTSSLNLTLKQLQRWLSSAQLSAEASTRIDRVHTDSRSLQGVICLSPCAANTLMPTIFSRKRERRVPQQCWSSVVWMLVDCPVFKCPIPGGRWANCRVAGARNFIGP